MTVESGEEAGEGAPEGSTQAPAAPGGRRRSRLPAILAVDDDAAVLRAVRADLRRRYRDSYRIVAAGGGPEAVEVVGEMKRRGDDLAVVVSDQRMPELGGVEVIGRVRGLYPDARTVLLTAYADTDVAISAINDVHLDHYVLKPWDPPEERLYPVLDDLLVDWRSRHRPERSTWRLVGHRWSPDAHRLRDFLARNRVPFRWLDAEAGEGARLLAASQPGVPPLLIAPDGTCRPNPTNAEAADRLGLQTRAADERVYDLAVVGAGPAGLGTAVYGASEGLDTVVLEADVPGGQAGTSSRIENYLGFPSGVAGGDLADRALTQARRLGAQVVSPTTVVGIGTEGPVKVLRLGDGSQIGARAVVLANGVQYRRLGVDGAGRFEGRGIYYGAAQTEARWVGGERVAVVGGANSAGQAAVFFGARAEEVLLLCRGPSLHAKMSAYLVRQIEQMSTISVRTGTEVAAVHGDDHLDALTLTGPGGEQRVDVTGLFVFIGAAPRTDWLGDVVARDRRGYVLTGADLDGRPLIDADGRERPALLFESSLPGVFAVGDVRAGSVKRVASAVGQGGIVVQVVHEYLAGR